MSDPMPDNVAELRTRIIETIENQASIAEPQFGGAPFIQNAEELADLIVAAYPTPQPGGGSTQLHGFKVPLTGLLAIDLDEDGLAAPVPPAGANREQISVFQIAEMIAYDIYPYQTVMDNPDLIEAFEKVAGEILAALPSVSYPTTEEIAAAASLLEPYTDDLDRFGEITMGVIRRAHALLTNPEATQ